jgi:hypothetical protein
VPGKEYSDQGLAFGSLVRYTRVDFMEAAVSCGITLPDGKNGDAGEKPASAPPAP